MDVFLAGRVSDMSRGQIQSLIKSGDILLNETKAKARQPVSNGDIITVSIPEPVSDIPLPQDIPLTILYEDSDIIVIDKAHGMVVHPAAGNADGTLVNALLHHCEGKLAMIAGEERPGIVHRLDKDTSGCLIAAKTDRAYESLVEQFSSRSCKKQYLAITQAPLIKPADTVSTQIGRHPVQRQKMAVLDPPAGKAAITDYQTLHTDTDSNTSLVLCDLHTGRTHQIRVHMLHAGAPLIGDPIYAKVARQPVQTGRLMLHAWQLSITHPTTAERLNFSAPIPDEFQKWTTQSPLTQ